MNLKNIFFKKDYSGLKLPPHLQEIQSTTNFSAKEILDFQKKFLKLCSAESNELNIESFHRFMRMMGVKSNATLIHRIFVLMDTDLSGTLSFREFMKYFNVLLKGNKEQKAEFCFLIIAVGNKKNKGKKPHDMSFNHNDLHQLLQIMRDSEMKTLGETTDKEDLETLRRITDQMMSLLKIPKGDDVTLDHFREVLAEDEGVLRTFQMIGKGLQSLMTYQGENKYTRTVRALRLVREKFETVLVEMNKINLQATSFGITPFGYGSFRSNAASNRGSRRSVNSKRTSRARSQTFMAGLAKNIMLPPRKSKFAAEKSNDQDSDARESNSRVVSPKGWQGPQRLKNAQNYGSLNRIAPRRGSRPGRRSRGEDGDRSNIVSPTALRQSQDTFNASKHYKMQPKTLNPNNASPKIKSTFNRAVTMTGVHKSRHPNEIDITKQLKMSDIGLIDESGDNSNSSVIHSLFNDETNIVFEKEDGIEKEKLKNINLLTFKPSSVVDFEDIRRMVEEIEQGMYVPKGEKDNVQIYNSEAQKEEAEFQHRYREMACRRMPTFRKVERVPEPDSKLFEEFEKFLGDDETKSQNSGGKEEDGKGNFVKRILESKQYREIQRKLQDKVKKNISLMERYERLRVEVQNFKQTVNIFKEELVEILAIFEHKMNKISIKQKKESQKKKDLMNKAELNTGRKESKIIITDVLWGTVIAITEGIEASVNSVENITDYESITKRDYELKNTFEISNPSLEKYLNVEFIDYAPRVFNLIRQFNHISKEQYLKSLGSECLSSVLAGNVHSFKGLPSDGKSGSFFFTTSDNKFFVKTIPEREFVVAVNILGTYLDFLNSKNDESGRSNTLISQIFGLHKIKFYKKSGKIKTTNIIVIGNIFASGIKPHRIYDLKGSKYKRITSEKAIQKGAPRKDNNFTQENIKLLVSPMDYTRIVEMIESDCQFLREKKIIDYSLLIGIYEKEKALKDEEREEALARQSSIEDEEDDEEYMRKASLGRDGAPEDDSFKHGLKKDLKKTIHMDLAADSNGNIQSIKPKRIGLDQIQSVRGSFSYGKRESDLIYASDELKPINYLESIDRKYIYIVGIIDTLTYFGSMKCVEYVGRRTFQSKEASCVPPIAYASRFIDFMKSKVFFPLISPSRRTMPIKINRLFAEKGIRCIQTKSIINFEKSRFGQTQTDLKTRNRILSDEEDEGEYSERGGGGAELETDRRLVQLKRSITAGGAKSFPRNKKAKKSITYPEIKINFAEGDDA